MSSRPKRLKGVPPSPVQSTPAKKRRISSSSKPSVVLDHTAFPHIMEAIILFSSSDVHSALRLTSRTLQRCVDTLFPRWITFGAPGGKLRPLKREGTSYEFVRLLDNRIWTSVDLDDLGSTAVVHPDDVCVGCEDKERCHVLADCPHMLADLGEFKMVRQGYTSCHLSLVNAQTCVTFFDFTSTKVTDQSIRWREPKYHKCVFHFVGCPTLALDDDRWLDRLTEDGCLTQDAHDIVVILVFPVTDNPPSSSLVFSLVFQVAGQVFPNVDPVLFPTQHQFSSLTFVDVESWDYHWFSEDYWRPDCRISDIIKDLIVDIFDAFYYPLGCPESTREWLDDGAPLFFPTLDEYRDQVGHEQFALEMGKGWESESGWTGTQR